MIALVTGAYGFVGRHVARHLAAEGHEVIGMGHGIWSREESRTWGLARWHAVDITFDALDTYAEAAEVIVHCAGSGSVAYSLSYPKQDFERSVLTVLAVLEYQRVRAPHARLVIPSSAGVYGSAQTMPIAVGAALDPVSPYGIHKKMAEELAGSYARHSGLAVAIVRLFSIYGIGLRKQLLWDACEKLGRGQVDFAGTGAETRDWLHVEDAAALIVRAAQAASSACPVFNGGTGVATANHLVLDQLATCLKDGLKPAFSGQSRSGDPQHYQADITETLRLGWQPKRDLMTEIAAYADWYKGGAA